MLQSQTDSVIKIGPCSREAFVNACNHQRQMSILSRGLVTINDFQLQTQRNVQDTKANTGCSAARDKYNHFLCDDRNFLLGSFF